MDIDLVYIWVDGNDPQWQTKRNAFVKMEDVKTEENCKGRYANNDELKYSLRSVEKHAPWIRRIFIVTDNQTPEWLDTSNKKIKIIDHKEIVSQEGTPCFNPSVIGCYLFKIQNLSEHFLYANDDMFFNDNVLPDFFFKKDGFPFVRLKKETFGKWHYRMYYLSKFLMGKQPGRYSKTIMDALLLAEKISGRYYSGMPHHNIDAFNKSVFCEAIEETFKEQAEKALTNHTRSMDDLQVAIVSYYALATNRGHLKYVGNSESMRIPVQKNDFMKRLLARNPKLFCLNDNQRVTDEDRKRIKPFLEELFPEKSTFEKL